MKLSDWFETCDMIVRREQVSKALRKIEKMGGWDAAKKCYDLKQLLSEIESDDES